MLWNACWRCAGMVVLPIAAGVSVGIDGRGTRSRIQADDKELKCRSAAEWLQRDRC